MNAAANGQSGHVFALSGVSAFDFIFLPNAQDERGGYLAQGVREHEL